MSRYVWLALLPVLVLGCAGPTETSVAPTDPGEPSPSSTTSAADVPGAQWTITLVRHAEPAPDGTSDPPLSADGEARARRLADLLAPQHGVAVLASGYRRTQQTAAATADAWGVAVETYDATAPAEDILVSALSDHPSGAILIVGHSNTVPELVGVLCGCQVDPIAESEHGVVHQVALDADGNLLERSVTQGY